MVSVPNWEVTVSGFTAASTLPNGSRNATPSSLGEGAPGLLYVKRSPLIVSTGPSVAISNLSELICGGALSAGAVGPAGTVASNVLISNGLICTVKTVIFGGPTSWRASNRMICGRGAAGTAMVAVMLERFTDAA